MNYFRKDHTADCKTYCVVFLRVPCERCSLEIVDLNNY